MLYYAGPKQFYERKDRMPRKLPKILGRDFFARDTIMVAKGLLGMYLVRKAGQQILSGRITEVEAYRGEDDLACHASRGRTRRTEVLYAKPGTLYVYLIYGMYWCLNFVTERKDFPSAVLIRAVEPVEGIDRMRKNRGWTGTKRSQKLDRLCNGPGKVCQALGITGSFHARLTGEETVWVEDRGDKVSSEDMLALPRVGVEYAKHCKDYPWRFQLSLAASKG